MGFNDLPNEFLDMLLNTEDIPLNQRILLRSVSRRWLPVIEDGLKKKNNLFIRDVSTRISAIDSSHLELQPGGLTSELVPLLSRLFSGTKQLTLAFGGFSDPVPSPNWRGVPSLLTQLGANLNSNLTPNLTSVKLCGCITETVIAPLANALTGLSHLSALSLDRGQSGVLLLPRIEGVLSHLEAFAFADLNAPTASLSSLKQLPTSLKHLHLMKCYSTGSVWPIIRHIGGLTTLNLGFGSCNNLDDRLFRNLALFTRLTELKLYGLDYRAPIVLPSETARTLSSIKRLTIELVIVYMSDASPVNYQAFFQAISVWFPCLEHFTLATFANKIPFFEAISKQQLYTVEIVEYFDLDPWSPDW